MNDPRFPGLFPPEPSRATSAPRPEREVYTVSRLNKEVRLLLESGLPLLWLEGELSNFAAPASGHWYFSLKDSQAQVRCAMWRQRNSALRFRPKDGLAVLVRARVGLYEPRGEYQLIVEHMEEARPVLAELEPLASLDVLFVRGGHARPLST